MPTYEYECSDGHRTEVFYKTFKEAEGKDKVECFEVVEDFAGFDEFENGCTYYCHKTANIVPSLPLQPHLYGDPVGYHKPSPTKRFTYKTVSQREGNASSVG